MKYDGQKLNMLDVEKEALILSNPVKLEIGEYGNLTSLVLPFFHLLLFGFYQLLVIRKENNLCFLFYLANDWYLNSYFSPSLNIIFRLKFIKHGFPIRVLDIFD